MSEIVSEYAKALFLLAGEKDCIEEYKSSLEKVDEIFKENPSYIDFLYTFAIPLEERQNALEKAFSDYIHRDVLSFLKLLCEKRHITEYFECANSYYELYNEIDKLLKVKVTSAVELSESQKELLKQKLENKYERTVVIDYVVDKSIIGGVMLETDGKIIDSSIKKHLKDIKDVIK